MIKLPLFFYSITLCLLLLTQLHLNAQTKSKETYVFNHPDRLKKHIGIRVSDSTEFIIYNNKRLNYTEIYQKKKSYWFSNDGKNTYAIDKTTEDTVGVENSNNLSLDSNIKYQWVLGDGINNGYFFKKGQIVLTVETLNRGKRSIVKIGFNEKEPNIEFLKIAALYKAHIDLTLNNRPGKTDEEESEYD